MFKKLCIFEKLIPIVLLLILTSCATTQKQPIVKAETIEKPEITNNLDNSLSDLTKQITNSITEDGKKKIAVIEFSDLDGNVTQFGKYLAEELITRLFRTKKFEVVERQLLNKVLSEQKLGITGIIDDESAIAIGKILGVDAIVSGSITDLGTSLKVNARVISTEKGKVFGVAGTKIVKDETVEKLMGIISYVQKEEVQKQTKKKEISKEVLKKVKAEKFTFELIKCEMSSEGNVTCDFLITNNDKNDREFKLYADRSRIFDDFGNEYHTMESKLADKKGERGFNPTSLLVSGVPTRAILNFRKGPLYTKEEIDYITGRHRFKSTRSSLTSNVIQEARGISLLEIYFDVPLQTPLQKAIFRNIPLSIGIISTVQSEEVKKQIEKEISKEVLKKVEVEKFTFEVTECEMSSEGRVTCDLLITNNEKEDRKFELLWRYSRMFDDFGNEYYVKEIKLANKEGMNPIILLVSDVPTRAILTFDNVSKEARSVALLKIYFVINPYEGGGPGAYRPIDLSTLPNACLRNIPLSK